MHFMDLVTLFAIGLGLAMDALAVAVTYGMSFSSRRHLDALKVSGAFGLFQAGMPVLGWAGGLALKGVIEAYDHWVAVLLLGYIGGKMLLGAIRGEESQPISTEYRTLVILAVATSIDALAVGLVLACLKVPLLAPIAIFGSVTFVLSYAGVVGGYELRAVFRGRGQRFVQGLGGVILAGIGIRILVEHLLDHGLGR